MGDLSKNFSRHEFSCNCPEDCGYDTADSELVKVLQDIADHFNETVHLNSAHRCPAWNAKIGGAPRSVHLTGKAADVVVLNVPPNEVQNYLNAKYPDGYGLGRYETFTHIDVRNCKARW